MTIALYNRLTVLLLGVLLSTETSATAIIPSKFDAWKRSFGLCLYALMHVARYHNLIHDTEEKNVFKKK